ncbi:MAG TPA: nuclear transport factor 2 family protein, partial [Gemmatimonadaceae bacterium]
MVALFDDEAIISNPLDPSPHYGREGARRFWRSYRDSFEEIRSDFSKVVSTDDTAMLEWTSQGTNAAGERVVYSGVSVVELRDGLVHRFRAYFDSHELESHPPEPKTV